MVIAYNKNAQVKKAKIYGGLNSNINRLFPAFSLITIGAFSSQLI